MAFRIATSAASATFVSTLSTSPGITTHTGDAGLTFFQTVSAQPLATFTDTSSNTWNGTGTPAFNVTANGIHYFVYVLWAQNITGTASEVLTGTVSGGNAQMTFNTLYFSNRTTSGALFDGSVGTYSETVKVTNHTPGPSVTTSFVGSDLASMAFDAAIAADTFTGTAGFTGATSNTAGTYFSSFSQYRAGVSQGTYTAPWTTANTVDGVSLIVALLAPIVSGGSSGLTMMGMG